MSRIDDKTDEDVYCVSVREVAHRFLHSILSMRAASAFDTPTAAAYARGFAAFFWNHKKGRVPKDDEIFGLHDKIGYISEKLFFMRADESQIFDIFKKRKLLCLAPTETIVADIDALTALIEDFSETVVQETYGRPVIKHRYDALRYLIYAHDGRLVGCGVETISAYRRYAELVASGSIDHTPYGNSGRNSSLAILNMPMGELKRRLEAYDNRPDAVILFSPRPFKPQDPLERPRPL